LQSKRAKPLNDKNTLPSSSAAKNVEENLASNVTATTASTASTGTSATATSAASLATSQAEAPSVDAEFKSRELDQKLEFLNEDINYLLAMIVKAKIEGESDSEKSTPTSATKDTEKQADTQDSSKNSDKQKLKTRLNRQSMMIAKST